MESAENTSIFIFHSQLLFELQLFFHRQACQFFSNYNMLLNKRCYPSKDFASHKHKFWRPNEEDSRIIIVIKYRHWHSVLLQRYLMNFEIEFEFYSQNFLLISLYSYTIEIWLLYLYTDLQNRIISVNFILWQICFLCLDHYLPPFILNFIFDSQFSFPLFKFAFIVPKLFSCGIFQSILLLLFERIKLFFFILIM